LFLALGWASTALAATPAWWNCSYGYRKQLTVSASAAVPSGYTVSLTFDHAALVSAGKSLASGNDLRVLYWTGAAWSELDRLLDPASAWNNGSTKIWFKTPASISSSSSDNNYYLYYGYSGAGSPPANGANVFLFYDGFESGNFSAWDGGAADYCPTGCSLTIDSTTVHTGTYSAKAVVVGDGNPDWARVTKTITGQTGLHASTYVYIPSGYSSTTDISVLHFYTGGWTEKVSSVAIRGSDDPPNFRKLLHGNWQPDNAFPGWTFASPALSTGAWHRVEQKVIVSPTSGRIEVWQDGVKSIDLSNQNTGDPATEKIDFTLFAIFWQNSAGGAATLYFDNNFLRLWVDPEPTTSLGSELANDCPPSGPSLCNWQYKRKLTFNNSAQAENLIDFPVLVVLNSSRINYGQTQDAGQDLRFYDADGVTQLAHEIEKWDEAGTSYVWVKVPQIDASSTTDHIWMYYGNATATDGQNKTAVWDGSFKMVHHLKETAGPHRDSTSNAKDSTVISVATQGSASGNINGADAFTGASGHNIDVDDASNALGMSSTDSITVEAWVKTSASGSYQFVVNKKTGTSDWQLHVNDTGKPDFWLWDGTNQARAYGATVVNNNNWHYLVARWTDSSSEARIFIDGASSASGTNASFSGVSNTNPLVIGEEGDANRGYNFTGTIDEVRYSKTARSNAWISAQYKSMTDTFITPWGSEQSNGTSVNYFTPDAAGAGMNVPVIFVGSICQVPATFTTSSSDIVIGPSIVTDATGAVVTQNGTTLSTVFFVKPEARPATGVTVTVDGKTLSQTLDIVMPSPDPNVTSGTVNLSSRSKRGTSVLGGLTVASGATLGISTTDTDGSTTGNQGYLPATILVKGDVNIAGTIDIKGQNGTNGGSACTGGDGGAGGPGGGGGGGGGVRDASCGGGPVTTNLGPLHDTYVRNGDETANGSDTLVLVKQRSTSNGTYRQGLIKFDTSSITGTITSATLKLNVRADPNWPDPVNLEIYEFTNNSWNESTVWSNRPPDSAFGAVLGTLATPASPDPTLLSINVTAYVLAQRAGGNNVMSFSARMAADANGGAHIDSKEGTVPPVLTIVSSAGGGATAAPGGAGMSGGGGGASKSTGTGGDGGSGAGAGGGAASGTTGGAGGVVLSGATGGGGGTADTALAGGSGGGGGTGNPFGTGGSGGQDNGGVAGQGGGGGGASGGGPGGGGGGGSYTVGAQGPDTTDGGFGGNATGNQQLVPLAGGSGGGGGGPDVDITSAHRGGGGGGGGGAVLIYATGSVNVSGTITAAGGNGASGYTSGGDGSGGGGGGSGGAIFLQSSQVTSSTNLLAGGGSAGTSAGTAAGGAGGFGRIRIDGLAAGATVPGTSGASKFIGPVIDTLVDTTVKGRADGGSTVTLYVYDQTGVQVTGSPYSTSASGSSGTVGTWTINGVTFPSGTGYLAVKQSSGSYAVLGPGRATKGLQIINWREVY
jgi:hypothetical protein